jgi:hypothetical protein
MFPGFLTPLGTVGQGLTGAIIVLTAIAGVSEVCEVDFAATGAFGQGFGIVTERLGAKHSGKDFPIGILTGNATVIVGLGFGTLERGKVAILVTFKASSPHVLMAFVPEAHIVSGSFDQFAFFHDFQVAYHVFHIVKIVIKGINSKPCRNYFFLLP